ncbi:MAG: AAA family ATPase [Micromonosporaceae bacterium]|nr:AAA family ATPase [Micromonosporaceae bacterium]
MCQPSDSNCLAVSPSHQRRRLAIIVRRGLSEGGPIDQVCVQCHTPADPSHRFCGRCGSALHARCASCDTVLPPGVGYCTNCGQPLNGSVDRTGVGREERRTVSVLFLDLIGFTGMAEQLDPEDVRRLQVDYFSTASAVLHGYGGLIEKYIGDAVMAVFGVPVETEHDASRAVLAGLALQRELTARPLAGRYQMPARVGVATGEVLVDMEAARDVGQALVSGDPVATASRLQQHAPPGGVLVSSATHRATLDAIRYDDEPLEVMLAGRSGPVQAWLAAASNDRQEDDPDEATPFVGRQQELDVLTGVLSRCVREGQPQLVSVVGEHGLGKSRLMRELRRRANSTGEVQVRWCVGRGLPYGEGSAYAALAEIVKSHAGILDSDLPAVAEERLTEALLALAPADRVARLTDLLGPLVGLPGRPAAAAEAESAWRDVLLALARHQPTVIAVEDLHYADPGMLRFLSQLVEVAEDVPLFLLCTYRPDLLDEHPAWAAILPGTLTVSLGPLRGGEFASLIESLLARHNLPTGLADRLTAITAGNPMYAVEYVRMLAERPAGDEDDLEIDLVTPDTVHGVVANRIDLLERAERTVLHAAAVLGERVWPTAIAAILDLDAVEVAGALRALCRRDMLVEFATSAVAGEPELGFRHQLLRDAAYRRLPRTARAQMHARAADWLGQLAGGRHDLAAAVARHRVAALELAESLGEDTQTAARHAREALTDAARAAYSVHAVEAALAHVTQALTLWPNTEEPHDRRAAELLRHRVTFSVDADEFYRDGGPKELARLADRMRDQGDFAGEAEAATLLGVAELMRAERGRAEEHLSRAVTLFADLPDSVASAEAYDSLGRLHMLEYRTDQAVTAAESSWRIAERLGLAEREAGGRITEAMSRYLAGDGDAVAVMEEILEVCRSQQLPALRRAAQNLAIMSTEEGDLARGMRYQEEADAVAGGRLHAVVSHSEEALLAYFSGDWVTLLQAAEAYLDVAGAETTEWDLQLRAQRAWIRVLCGEPPGEDVARCLDVAERSGFARLRLCACAHGALCRVLEGDSDGAVELLRRLVGVWRGSVNSLVSEWLPAAAHSCVLLAEAHPAAADFMGEVIRTMPRRTRWVIAADQVVAGAVALGRGEPAQAAELFGEAVRGYDAVGGVSDGVLAAAWTARAWLAAGDKAAAEPCQERVREFAGRCRARQLAALVD